jgi:hypothetical protein
MAIERAIVKGTIGGVVQIRNMFTCNVAPSGGDTSGVLWQAYLSSIYTEIIDILSNTVNFYGYELYERVGSQWQLTAEENMSMSGSNTGQALPNAVAVVLIAKAAGIGHIGRKFFGSVAEVGSLGNALESAYLVGAAATLLAYITPFTGIGGGVITPGVMDKNGIFHAFVGGFVSSLLGSMRRRKPGNGM